MINDNNIPQFTAADIEKYHRGVLSNKERHALEKAAMDDPFLADALEGYAVAGVNAAADMADLRKRLAERTGGAKVISMVPVTKKNNFRILKAAVVIAFIAGSGLLIYQLGFNNKKEGIASTTPANKKTTITDTSSPAVTTTNPSGGTTTPSAENKSTAAKTTNSPVSTEKVVTKNESKEGSEDELARKDAGENVPVTEISKAETTPPVVKTSVPEKADDQAPKYYNKFEAEKKEVVVLDGYSKQKTTRQNNVDIVTNKPVTQQNAPNGAVTRSSDQNGFALNQHTNVFRGVVTDRDNNPVPFANVTNLQDNNTGTYTDVKGNFNLTSPDSILTVQVRSVGYENANIQLRNNVPTNQVRMQEDRNLDKITLDSKKLDTAGRGRMANVKVEQPEPADGWDNYNAYIANNVSLPEDLKDKKTISGEVQVSFEVDKDGEPTNIKIVKSLCDKCDQEAIRLVKDGPKWKRKARKGRTTVTINF